MMVNSVGRTRYVPETKIQDTLVKLVELYLKSLATGGYW